MTASPDACHARESHSLSSGVFESRENIADHTEVAALDALSDTSPLNRKSEKVIEFGMSSEEWLSIGRRRFDSAIDGRVATVAADSRREFTRRRA